MADLGGTFDSNTVDPQAPMEPLPTGWYAMSIVESEIKEVASGNGNKYLQLTFKIDESRHPQFKGKQAWARLNLWNSNQQASQIAQRELSALCRAVGVPTIKDSDELHHKPLAVRVAYRPAKGEYGESNDIKGYDAVSNRFAGAVGAPAAAAPSAPPTQTAEPTQAQAPTGATPPWGAPS